MQLRRFVASTEFRQSSGDVSECPKRLGVRFTYSLSAQIQALFEEGEGLEVLVGPH